VVRADRYRWSISRYRAVRPCTTNLGGGRLDPMATVVGVISDTHGLVRPEALRTLQGCSHILHAGDVGRPEVLASLSQLAPVIAVRGNNDKGAWAEGLPHTEVVEIESTFIYLLHDLADLDLDPVAATFSVVVSGHSHRPRAEVRGGVLYLNPGSAGPRRFTLPVAVARITVSGATVVHELIELEV